MRSDRNVRQPRRAKESGKWKVESGWKVGDKQRLARPGKVGDALDVGSQPGLPGMAACRHGGDWHQLEVTRSQLSLTGVGAGVGVGVWV